MQNSRLLLLVRNLSFFWGRYGWEGPKGHCNWRCGLQKCGRAPCLLDHWQCFLVSWNDDYAFAYFSVKYFHKFWDTASYREQATILRGPHSSHLLQSHFRLYWLKSEATLLICHRADAWPCVDVSELSYLRVSVVLQIACHLCRAALAADML